MKYFCQVLCLVFGLFFSSQISIHAADWQRFLGPHGTGKSSESRLLATWSDTGPRRIWGKTIGTGYSAPSIFGDGLVLHHRKGNEEIVEFFSAESGQSLWQYRYPSAFIDPFGYNNGPRSSPILTQDKCYTLGAEGKLLCLEKKSGRLIWQRDLADDFTIPRAFFGVGSSPILESGLLIVMVGGQPNSGMVAFDSETGKTIWESVGQTTWEGRPKIGWAGEPPVIWKDYAMQASYASPVVKSIHGKRHLLCFMRQGLVSLEPTTGKLRFCFWFRSRVHESVNAMNPIVHNDLIFLSGAYYRIGSVLLQVSKDGKSIKELWRDPVLEVHWATPILHKGHLYAFSGRNESDARLRCVEFLTGKLKWDRDESWRKGLRVPNVFGRGSLIMADEKLFALGEAGLLGILEPNPKSLIERARFQVPELRFPCWTAPVISQKRIYLRNEKHLLCYDLSAP